jgi:capsid assembly protease
MTNPTPKRSLSMATNETEQSHDQPDERQAIAPEQAPTNDAPATPHVASGPERTPEAGIADRLRSELAEIAAVVSQAAHLGVTIDTADALRKGIAPDALRRSVLDTLAARAEATTVIASAPSTPASGDSPIVRRAKERASAARA